MPTCRLATMRRESAPGLPLVLPRCHRNSRRRAPVPRTAPLWQISEAVGPASPVQDHGHPQARWPRSAVRHRRYRDRALEECRTQAPYDHQRPHRRHLPSRCRGSCTRVLRRRCPRWPAPRQQPLLLSQPLRRRQCRRHRRVVHRSRLLRRPRVRYQCLLLGRRPCLAVVPIPRLQRPCCPQARWVRRRRLRPPLRRRRVLVRRLAVLMRQ